MPFDQPPGAPYQSDFYSYAQITAVADYVPQSDTAFTDFAPLTTQQHTWFDIRTVINHIIEEMQYQHIQVKVYLEDDTSVFSSYDLAYTLLHKVLNDVVQNRAHHGTEVYTHVNIFVEEDLLMVDVEDNGIGTLPASLEPWVALYHTSRCRQWEREVTVVQGYVPTLDAQVYIQSIDNCFFKFTVCFPVHLPL